MLILDLNDSALAALDGDKLIASEPGFALIEDDRVVSSGDAAARRSKLHPRRTFNDFWHRLSVEPIKGQARLSRADLASAQLASLLPPAQFGGREVTVILPSYLSRDTLGLVLGVLKANALQPVALVDAAVAATGQRYVDQVAMHVELGLHCAWVARVRQSQSQSTLEDVRSLDESGLNTMYEAWLKFFAAQFVRQCRFDPLHSAQSEQRLYDALPAWLARIEAGGGVNLDLDAGGQTHSISVERVDVINVVAEHYQRIADMARALLAGGDTAALQMRFSVSALPGFAELLTARVGGRYYAIEDNAAATTVQGRLAGRTLDSTRVVRELPTEGEIAAPLTDHQDDDGLPTHVLLGARAIALDSVALMIGAGTSDTPARYLLVEGSPAGVSGSHCDVLIDAGQCLLTDHSRYGTFLNGNRINGTAALRAGDTIRIGTPGLELQLIRAETL